LSSSASNDKSDPQSTNDLINKSIVSLHPIEKKILSILYPLKEKWITDNQLIKETELSIDQIRRGVEWLKFKNLILIEDSSDVKIYLKNKSTLENNDFVLPERKMVNCIKKGNNNIVDIIKGVEFDNNKEVFAAIKFGKNNNWINLENNSIFLLPESEFLSNEEKLIEKLIKLHSLLLSN
jgi:phenylalanyl-tRNA synthetase alpha chain